MRPRILSAVAMIDLAEVSHNRSAWIPTLVVPLIFFVIIPVAFLTLPRLPMMQTPAFGNNMDIDQVMTVLPAEIKALIAGLTTEQILPYAFLGYFLAPMFLILPLMTSSIVSSESFAGEKERKTLEGLLYSPATDAEIFTGKVLAAFIPAMALSLISFAVYTLVVNTVGYELMGGIWFPLKAWWPLIFWISPAFAILGTLVTVLISSRVKTFMEAYQSGGSLVVIVLALFVGQISGVLYLNVLAGMLVGLALWLIDAGLLWFCLRIFNRSVLISKV